MTQPAGSLQFDIEGMEPEQAVNALIGYAADLGVSDLFFTSHDNHLMVQARHQGVLRSITHLPAEFGRRCFGYIKSAADLNVAERRRPQDGRWIYRRAAGKVIDLRINIIPTLYGEDVTLRLLDRDTRLLNLDQLGLSRPDLNQLLGMLASPSGLILVTGPTGSGKTTTLYACLNQLNNGERKINTIEDPVEYAFGGIRQSQVNAKIDVGFADLLRNVLRQAPDVIMVGEIRDPETAATAVLAANSGHLVLATLHAPSAVGAIQSLFNLGVHPHFLSGSLLGVVTQRLIRTLCPACRQSFDLSDSPNTFEDVRKYLGPGEGFLMYGPRGCAECRNLGYNGRTGVFEVLMITPALRRLILDRAATPVLRAKAVEDGLMECRLSALLKVARGETSIEEVFRVIPTEYLTAED
ncbi:MAG TPA: GspE/PulE family protein [Gemmataceae bacterium]|jgi:type II secretory ATPase GspE/PulE/Tfp pilus assembly ATPase PilB-like protein